MTDKKYDNDYEYTKQTLYDLIEKGREGIEEMIEVAKSSEHPRAYEVLSKLIKDVGDVSDKLMDLNKKHKDITKPEREEQEKLPGHTTNNVFIGTTTDLQRMLQDANASVEKDITPSGTEG